MALTKISSTKGIKGTTGNRLLGLDNSGSTDIKEVQATGDQIADDGVAESKLQISNAGTNGQFLQKQSGNTGGLTWATVSVPDSDKIEEGNTSVETVDTGSDGNVSIKTEGTERVKIRNDGIVDIGASNGAANVNLNVKGTSGTGNVDTGNIGKVNIASSHVNVPNAENIVFGQLHFGHAGNASGPIIEGASGGLWSTNNLPSALKFYTVPASSTTQTERLRISKDGAFGVGGANYGTSGQVLTSGGASAAPTWASASGDFKLLHTVSSVTAASSQELWNGFTDDYDLYKIIFRVKIPSGGGELHYQVGPTSGYITSGTLYRDQRDFSSGNNTVKGHYDGNHGYIGGNVKYAVGELLLYYPCAPTGDFPFRIVIWNGWGSSTDSNPMTTGYFSGSRSTIINTTDQINKIQLKTEQGGNITVGEWKVYGIK